MATILLRRSQTGGAAPASLMSGEIAINEADGKMFYRAVSGAVTSFTFTDAKNLTGGSITGNMAVTQGIRVIFGHANQVNGSDGAIAAGSFGEGLNIVGVQTVSGNGRKIAVWGEVRSGDGAVWTVSTSGNAGTATKLQTARTISGVVFDGTANITLNTSAITENTNLYFTDARARAATGVLDVGYSGAVDDDLDATRTANGTAFASVIASATGGRRIRIRRTNTGSYRVPNSTQYYFSDCVIDADPGVRLRGRVVLGPNVRVERPFWLDFEDGTITYSEQIGGEVNKALDDFSVQITHATAFRNDYQAIDLTTCVDQQVAGNSDAWATDTSVVAGSSNADVVVRTVSTVDNLWHATFIPVRGGQRVDSAISYSANTRGVFIRTTAGYYVLYGAGGAATRAYKLFGASAVTEGTVDWVGRSEAAHHQFNVGRLSVRVYDRNTWSVLLNGVEIMTPMTVQGDILEAGFGLLGGATFTGLQIVRPVRVTEREITGKTGIKVLIDGDSTADDAYYHAIDGAIREALDGVGGLRVMSIENRAVSGDNSGSVLTRLQNQGTNGANYVVIKVGRNDIQYSMALSTSFANISSAIDIIQAAYATPVICIPGCWYLKTEASGKGQNTQNSNAGAPLRQAMLQLAATKGCLIYEEEFAQGPILPSFLTLDPNNVDQRLRDAIHQTNALYRLDGYQIARVIAGHYLRRPTPAIRLGAMPTITTRPDFGPRNSWVATAGRWEVSDDGRVSLSGYLTAGTVTDGTTMYLMPGNMRPSEVKRFVARTSNAAKPAQIDLLFDGSLQVRGIDATVAWVSLDGCSYYPA